MSAPVAHTSSGLVGANPSSSIAADGRQRIGRQLGELDAHLVSEVGQQRAFSARIMHRGNASALGPPPGREQFKGVAELGEIGDLHGAGRRAERLPRRMLAGQGPGVCGHHRPAARRAADGEDHHGHVLLRGAQQGLPQPRDGPRRLEQ